LNTQIKNLISDSIRLKSEKDKLEGIHDRTKEDKTDTERSLNEERDAHEALKKTLKETINNFQLQVNKVRVDSILRKDHEKNNRRQQSVSRI